MIESDLGKTVLLKMYSDMVLIRRLEDKLHDLAMLGKVGIVHLSAGQEAVAVGVCAALRDEDYILSTHRNHGHIIAKGGNIKCLVAETFTRKTGYNRGKAGDMHIAVPDKGVLVSNAIVGSNIPIATGVALAIRNNRWDKVAVCFFGDGAVNTGAFHESLNMAALWKLPIVYVCENNLYANTTPQIPSVSNRPTSVSMLTEDISDRACAYKMPGVTVDGMDPIAVYQAAKEAVQHASSGLGPTLIECKTYRYYDHSEGQPQNYRTADEVERFKKNDPIPRFRKRLLEEGILSLEDDERIDSEAVNLVDDAIKFAEESPDPEVDDLVKGVYAED